VSLTHFLLKVWILNNFEWTFFLFLVLPSHILQYPPLIIYRLEGMGWMGTCLARTGVNTFSFCRLHTTHTHIVRYLFAGSEEEEEDLFGILLLPTAPIFYFIT
jgi:hypothetical protein